MNTNALYLKFQSQLYWVILYLPSVATIAVSAEGKTRMAEAVSVVAVTTQQQMYNQETETAA